jgi:hypothetical protein
VNRGESPERGVGIGISNFRISEVLMTRGWELLKESYEIDMDHPI